MEQTQKDNTIAQTPDTPEVKQKHAGGRHPKGWYEADIQEVLNGSARSAARLIQAHMEQSKGNKTIKESVLKICFYVIDHAIGKARQKIEHSGGILSYAELSKSATNLDKKPRDILADVEELASKYKEKTGVSETTNKVQDNPSSQANPSTG